MNLCTNVVYILYNGKKNREYYCVIKKNVVILHLILFWNIF